MSTEIVGLRRSSLLGPSGQSSLSHSRSHSHSHSHAAAPSFQLPASPAILSCSALERLAQREAPPSSPSAASTSKLLAPIAASKGGGGASSGGLAQSSSAPLLMGSKRLPLLGNRERILRNKQAFDRRLSHDFWEAERSHSAVGFYRHQGDGVGQSVSSSAVPQPGKSCESFFQPHHSYGDRHDVRPTVSSRRENFRKDRLEFKLQQAREACGSSLPRASSSPAAANLQGESLTAEELGLVKTEVFLADLSAVEKQFQELEKSLRLEHLSDGSNTDKMKAEREVERRRKDELLRRARKKEQSARDPKKKVTLRIENTREFERDASEKNPNIPMTSMDFAGGFKGHEHIHVVDVQVLQQKCCFMGQGIHVSTMLENMAARERQEAALSYSRSSRRSSTTSKLGKSSSSWTGKSSKCLTLSSVGQSTAEFLASGASKQPSQGDLYELRRKSAQGTKDAVHVSGLLHRIKGMRNSLNYSIPYHFEVGEEPSIIPDAEPVGHLRIAPPASMQFASTMPARFRGNQGKKIAALVAAEYIEPDDDDLPPESPKARLKFRRAATQQAALMSVAGEAGGAIVEASLDKTRAAELMRTAEQEEGECAALELRRRVRVLWAAARAVTQWIWVKQRVEHQNRSMEVMKSMLVQLGEWSRVKQAITRFTRLLYALQRACRSFVALKKKRCAVIDKDWVKVEDAVLQTYFRELGLRARVPNESSSNHLTTAMAVKQKKVKAKLAQMTQSEGMEDSTYEAGQGRSYDWRAYRIPVRKRREAISRYYMARLRRKVQQEQSFMETVTWAVSAERDLVVFLRNFGATDASIQATMDTRPTPRQTWAPTTMLSLWQLSEDQILQLIAATAQTMVSDPHFKYHPANLDVPDQSYLNRRRRSQMDNPVSLGRLAMARNIVIKERRPSGSKIAGGDNKSAGGKGNVSVGGVSAGGLATSVNEVLTSLSPRFREILEELRETPGIPDSTVPAIEGQFPAADASAKHETFVLGFDNHSQMQQGAASAGHS
mmetsp:Transcript_51026/g.110548  ORF Transcript_51026/g.110548 Transcript_51026/m.110548 type:complete len:1007 (+) Transcript_51026:182-3202(+)